MRKLIIFVIFLTVMMAGCESGISDIANETTVDLAKLESQAYMAVNTNSPIQIQENINKLAPLLAKFINRDKSIKDLLTMEIGKGFEGDHEVLYEMIANKTLKNGKTFRNELVSTYGLDIENKIKTIPYFNISIPVNFEKWNSYDGPIYVIPMRYDINDLDIVSLPGYDGEGNIREFPADTPPDFPVIVIGINEKVDLKIKQQQKTQNNPHIANNIQPMSVDGGDVNHDEILRGILLTDDFDTWYNANAEIYCLYVVGENEWAIRQDYPNVDDKYIWYSFDSTIFYYLNTPNNMYWKLMIRESDYDWGTYIDYTVKGGFTWKTENYYILGSFDLGELISNEDDTVGQTQMYFYHSLNSLGYSEILVGKGYIRLGYKETAIY